MEMETQARFPGRGFFWQSRHVRYSLKHSQEYMNPHFAFEQTDRVFTL